MSDDSEKERGNVAFRRGDYATALKHYDKAIKNAGNSACAALFSNKAAAWLELEEYDLCTQQCFKALVAPSLTDALRSKIYRRMGKAYKAQEKWEKAMEAFKKSESVAPTFAIPKENPGAHAVAADSEAEASWETCQKRGNEFFAAGKFELAISAYADAIELKRQVAPQKELADLLANKAAAYFADGLPMDAFWDCQSALFVQPGHLKATFRLAKAHSYMAKYQEAKEVLEKSPHSSRPEFQAEISRLNRLLREQQHGEYDLKSLLKEAAASKTPHLDNADFNGGVGVKWISKEKGNGLIALRDFAPGDLLFVSKAFEATYRSECKPRRHLEPGKLATNDATENECIFRTLRRVSRNEDLAKEFFRLDAGPGFQRVDADDPISPIDPKRVAAIVSNNSLGLADAEEEYLLGGEHPGFDAVRSGFAFAGCGVWLLASFINHSCAPNTTRFFVGDLMFARASRRIRKDEELTTSYSGNETDYKFRQAFLRNFFGFRCSCEMCVFDLKRVARRPHLEEERTAFANAFSAMCEGYRLKGTTSLTVAAEEMRRSVEDFATRLAYKGRFDRSLQSINTALAIAYSGDGQFLKAAKAFEVAYFAVVGNGSSSDDIMYSCNSTAREACYLCIHIAHNLLLGKEIDNAREYLRKMQTAAKILWGSADKELLELLYPNLPIRFLFESLT